MNYSLYNLPGASCCYLSVSRNHSLYNLLGASCCYLFALMNHSLYNLPGASCCYLSVSMNHSLYNLAARSKCMSISSTCSTVSFFLYRRRKPSCDISIYVDIIQVIVTNERSSGHAKLSKKWRFHSEQDAAAPPFHFHSIVVRTNVSTFVYALPSQLNKYCCHADTNSTCTFWNIFTKRVNHSAGWNRHSAGFIYRLRDGLAVPNLTVIFMCDGAALCFWLFRLFFIYLWFFSDAIFV